MFPGGPPVVKAAPGAEITKEELGGPDIHVRQSGVVDNLADDEDDALDQIRRFLSYLPSSVDELPPRGEPRDDPPTAATSRWLRPSCPATRAARSTPARIIEVVVDEGSFFEIAPVYGRSRVTGLARIDGFPVGVMANDPLRLGGATDVAAGDKVVRLIQLCDTFHLPLVDFADEPGLDGRPRVRAAGHRAGRRPARLHGVDSRMPYLVFVVRRLYGVGGQSHHRPSGMFRRYAWPSASWGSMHIAGGASAAYRREIEAADDPAAKQAEIEARLQRLASPFRTAEATGQDIIDPRDTRPLPSSSSTTPSACSPASSARPSCRTARDAVPSSAIATSEPDPSRVDTAVRASVGSPAHRRGRCDDRSARQPRSHDVRDVRVLELAGSLAGAYCARLFATTGADVVLAEPADGGAVRGAAPWIADDRGGRRSASHEYLDAGKRSVGPRRPRRSTPRSAGPTSSSRRADGDVDAAQRAPRAASRPPTPRTVHVVAQRLRPDRAVRGVARQPARRLGGRRLPVPHRASPTASRCRAAGRGRRTSPGPPRPSAPQAAVMHAGADRRGAARRRRGDGGDRRRPTSGR